MMFRNKNNIGKLILFFVIQFFALSVLGQNSKQKIVIDTSTIKYVKILKTNTKKAFSYSTKKLNKKQYCAFAQKWNNSKELGADKFAGSYTIVIYQKNKRERRFTINNNKIQESGWLTYDLVDKKYFDELWKKCK